MGSTAADLPPRHHLSPPRFSILHSLAPLQPIRLARAKKRRSWQQPSIDNPSSVPAFQRPGSLPSSRLETRDSTVPRASHGGTCPPTSDRETGALRRFSSALRVRPLLSCFSSSRGFYAFGAHVRAWAGRSGGTKFCANGVVHGLRLGWRPR